MLILDRPVEMSTSTLRTNGVLSHNSAPKSYTSPRITWAREKKFGMNHAPIAGSMSRPNGLQYSNSIFISAVTLIGINKIRFGADLITYKSDIVTEGSFW